jgi:ABC-type transport system involved in multi-copper enzyme maturation permease subunit
VIVIGIMVLLEVAVQANFQLGSSGEVPGAKQIAAILQLQFFSVAILFMASGCGAVSDDLRSQTFQLYFSRPVERWEYTAGKFLGLMLLGSLVTIVPSILLGGLRLAFYSRTEMFSAAAEQTLTAVALSMVVTTVATCVVLGLSAATRKTGYAVLSWIGVLLVPLIMNTILNITTQDSDVASLWSLNGNLDLVTRALLVSDGITVPVWGPWLLLAVLSAAGIGTLVWRVNQLEGVA